MSDNNNNKNHRCSVCDYTWFSNVHDQSYPRTFRYSNRENGYICSDCDGAIHEALADFVGDTNEMPLERPREAADGDLEFFGTLSPENEDGCPEPTVAVLETMAVDDVSSKNG